MAEYHLPDAILLEYATGVADPGHALIAACHLTLCPRCRARVAELEAFGAALVLGDDEGAPADPSPDAFADRLLAEVFDTSSAAQLDAASEALGSDLDLVEPALALEPPEQRPREGVFPWPLQRVIGPFEDIPWRTPLPGLQTFDFQLPGATTITRMTRARAGMKVARHDHRGLELDLILAGGLHDRTRGGEFERGDIQSASEGVTHSLEILPGEPCLILSVNEGNFVPDGLVSRLLYRYLGWS
ncbi:anti-sigm factor, ChrR [Plesiocystis pacifica SIR-1]|uniref:Anti-sigm factor, ChrR n=1 Tax=Plesiocystis pacifica SIR-1 TaxID=391625 RepID=A6G5W5_9BACT|nr:hypothetical protein [Plesiocystis pacifica]EDM78739.1 anti-sigm factor, ChrR [Plesiocystis pacifica SIR-1]